MSRSAPLRASFACSALVVFLPLALLASASLRASEGPEESVVPGGASPVTLPTAEATPDKSASLQLQVLRAGEGPFAWAIPGRIARTFITNTPNHLVLTAAAGVPKRPELSERIEWEVTPPAGFQIPGSAVLRGSKLVLRLSRPGGNSTGMGEPLSLTVRARVTVDGRPQVRMATLTQDLRDRLRQEYVDLERSYVPARQDLLDEEQFQAAFGKKYPGVTFASLNWSRQPGKEDRYPVILAAEELVRTIHETERLYGRDLIVSSGFRNPVRQVEVHGSVAESHHQYGRAVDLYVVPDSAPPKSGRDYASEGDWLRLAAATMRAGGGWVEPMLACHVNTNGCHVHVDVREHGTRTEVVQVRGKITDPTGLPVPGATVRLAGMPARTNEWGLFSLKHVLTPKEYELTVEAPGRGVRTQRVAVGSALTTVAMRLPADPNPALVARIQETRHGDDGVSVRVAVRNAGRTPAVGLRLAAASIDLPSRGGRVSPAHLPLVRPGQETAIEVQLPPEGKRAGPDADGVMPVVLSASYRTDRGESRAQALRLTVPMTVPRSAEASTIPVPQAQKKIGVAPPGEVGAAGGGLALGASAAAAAALARKKAKKAAPAPPAEPSVDPASELPGS